MQCFRTFHTAERTIEGLKYYLRSSVLAVQKDGVSFVHEDPVTKSKRVTDISGAVVSAIETDPFGADTNRSSNAAFQPRNDDCVAKNELKREGP